MLPGVDDGAEDWEASMAMARMAVEDGITQAVLTPHWTGAPGEPARVGERFQELEQRLAGESIPLRLHRGNEVVLVPTLAQALDEQRALTLGGSSYVLLETAQLEHGVYTHSALFQLQSSGYRIILAHPERVRAWQTDQNDLLQLLWRGCYLQVNAGSLLGSFGTAARKAAEQFLRFGWVSLLASDGHSPTVRPPLLSEALSRCSKLIGSEAAHFLVQDNPLRVLCNDMLPAVDPDAVRSRRSFWFLRWPFGTG